MSSRRTKIERFHQNPVLFCRLCLTKNDLLTVNVEKLQVMISFLSLPLTFGHSEFKLCINCNSIISCMEKFKRNCLKADGIFKQGIESVLKNTFLSSVTDESVNLAFDTIQNWLGDVSVILRHLGDVKTEREDSVAGERIIKEDDESDIEMEVEALHEEDMFVMDASEENILFKVEPGLEDVVTKQEQDDDDAEAYEGANEDDLDNWEDEEAEKDAEPEQKPKRRHPKNYECEICGKRYIRCDYERHMNMHNGFMPYKCTVEGCDRSFAAPKNLNIHLREIHHIKNGQKLQLTPSNPEPNMEAKDLEIDLSQLLDISKKGQKRPYKCDMCEKYYSKSELVYHRYWHKNIRPFDCKYDDCDKRFSSPRDLTRHVGNVHNPEKDVITVVKTNEPKITEIIEQSMDQLESEVNILDDEAVAKYFVEERRGFKRPYQCDICSRFYGRSEIKYHMNIHANLTPFKCVIEECDRWFRSPREMRCHVKKFHRKYVKPAPLPAIVRRPPPKNLSEDPTTSQQSPSSIHSLNVMCPTCGREVRKKHFKEHLRTHDKPELKCVDYGECNEQFRTIAQLASHIRNRHDPSYVSPVPASDYICELCGKTFSKARLVHHMNVHLGVTPFKCDFENCTESFISPAGLRQHRHLVHSEIKIFRCHYCPSKFATKEQYAAHRQEECSTKFVTCHICGKTLGRFSLKNHLAVHSGIKSFVCPVESCGKSFVRKDKLKQHSISHSAYKRFSCLICSQQFGYKQTLDKHMAKVHGTEKS